MPIGMAEFKEKKNRENQMQTKLQRRKNQFCLFMEMRIGQSFEDIIVEWIKLNIALIMIYQLYF